MAEDEDDESFGDFTFAPSFYFPHQQSSHQINGPKSPVGKDLNGFVDGDVVGDDDDEWGDFVETPLGSAASSTTPSKPFDPFNFFSTSLPESQAESSPSGRVESEKANTTITFTTTQRVKPKGAIPLSIFGDIEEEQEEEEEEEEEKRSGVGDPHDNSGKDSKINGVNNGSKSYDIIASLYNFNQPMNFSSETALNLNGSNSDTNGVDSSKKDSILELNGANLDYSSVARKPGSNIVTGLNNQSQKLDIGDGFGASSNGISLNLNAASEDVTMWSSGFNGVDLKSSSNFNIISVNDKNKPNNAENGSSETYSNGMEAGLMDNKSSGFGGWNLDVDGFKSYLNVKDSGTIQLPSLNGDGVKLNSDLSGRNEELGIHGGGGGDDDDDEDGWDFKDAYSESKITNGNEKEQEVRGFTNLSMADQELQVESKVHEVSDSNSYSREFKIGSNGSMDLFSMSNGSFDLFATMNSDSSRSHDIAVGLNTKPSAEVQNSVGSNTNLRYEYTNGKDGLDPYLAVGSTEFNEDFGEFKAAFKQTEQKQEGEPRVQKNGEIDVLSSEISYGSNGSIDLFAISNGSVDFFTPVNGISDDSNRVGVKFNVNPSAANKDEAAHNDTSLYTYSRIELAVTDDTLDSQLVFGSAEHDEDFGEFTAAFAETAQKQEGVETRGKNHTGALPLSIFGDEEPEIDYSLNIQDTFFHQPGSYKGNSPNSTNSINDIISNLYSQAEQISSADSTKKPDQNGSSPSDFSLINSGMVKGVDCFDNKDAFCEGGVENQTSILDDGDSLVSTSTKSKLDTYVDFYSNLKDELCSFAFCHLESLKEAQSRSAMSGEDANMATLLEEIQEACKDSGQKHAITKDHHLEDHTRRGGDLNGYITLLQKPEFHVLESEYALQGKLSLVESDCTSALQLIKHAKAMLMILSLGSLEDRFTYVSIWSKIISVCAQELQHGAQIWKESLQKNVQSQLLFDPRGKRFVLAMGEIYRVAVVLGASAKLYRPWTFSSSVELSSIYTLLNECHALWYSSGLEEALFSLSVSTPSDDKNTLGLLVDSIKYTRDLDAAALQNHVFTEKEPVCRLSLLTSRVAPGMTKVVWGGEKCFVKLANLWANLISHNCPNLPSLHV